MPKKKVKKLYLTSESFPLRLTMTESRADMLRVMAGLSNVFGYNIYQSEQCVAVAFCRGKYLLKSGKEENLQKLSDYLRKLNIYTEVE